MELTERGHIGPGVQRKPDSGEHGEQTADEHCEEVVDARAASTEPIEALQLKSRGNEQRNHWQAVEVLPERRLCLRDRDDLDEPALEANVVGKQEGGRR